MKTDKKKGDNKILLVTGLIIFLVIAFLASLSFGSVNVSVRNVLGAFFSPETSPVSTTIIRDVRLPRVIAGLLAGAGLSVAGVILQGVMNNALASPNTIGVGSGAGFFVMLALAFFPGKIWLQPVFAFGGALFATLMIFALAYFADTSRITIILAGITVSSFLSAGINLIKTLNTDIALNINSFLIGSLSGVSLRDITVPGILIVFATLASLFLTGPLNILGLGDDVAASLGMRVSLVRFLLMIVSSILAGCVVSYAGVLGFVGLIVPHICRRLFGNDAKLLIPCSILLGASFVMICDLLARVLFSPYEIPTGIIMSFIGGPFFMYLLIIKKGGRRLNA
ncbi:MAG: iron ABC transporter permease [Lachnospiraceae bacterium]|nr:iron ABC transporter permease [Lachnospiraceae bacterium]